MKRTPQTRLDGRSMFFWRNALEAAQMLDAIEELGLKVTLEQVATKLGRRDEIDVVEAELNRLLCDSGGTYHTTKKESSWEIVYVFPRNFRQRIRAKRTSVWLRDVWYEHVWPVVFQIIKVFFGVFIVFSFVLALFLLIAVSNVGRRGGGGHFHLHHHHHNPFFCFWLFRRNPFFRGDHRGPDPVLQLEDEYRHGNDRDQDGGFLEDVFCFLFGPPSGRPGPSEEEKWEEIRTIIVHHRAVVPGEVLEPFMSTQTDENQSRQDNWMTDVVARLGGEPTSSDDGLLVYKFPTLVSPGFARRRPKKMLKEEYWKFSDRSTKWPMGLGIANLFVLLLVWKKMEYFRDFTPKDPSLATLAIVLYNVLRGPLYAYAILYLLIPLSRYVFCVVILNHFRSRRNLARETILRRNEALENDKSSLYWKKLEYARHVANTIT